MLAHYQVEVGGCPIIVQYEDGEGRILFPLDLEKEEPEWISLTAKTFDEFRGLGRVLIKIANLAEEYPEKQMGFTNKKKDSSCEDKNSDTDCGVN